MKLFRKVLDEKNIEWHDASDEDGEIWICRTHFEHEGNIVSVVNGFGTYGGFAGANADDYINEGLLEVMIGGNDPVGWLTFRDAVQMIFE